MLECPVCSSELSDLLTEKLRDGEGKVYYCPSCDLGVLDCQKRDNLKEYYSEEYWRTHGPELGKKTSYEDKFNAYVDVQHRRLDLLKPHFGKDKTQ